MKKSIVTIMSLILVIVVFGAFFVFADEKTDNAVRTVNISCNKALMERVFPAEKNNFKENTDLHLSFDEGKTALSLKLNYDGHVYEAELSGSATEIITDTAAGYSGVYEGMISSAKKNKETVSRHSIVANVTICGDDVFCTLTIYFDSNLPTTLMFGERTKGIKAISAKIFEDVRIDTADSFEDNGCDVAEKGTMVNGTLTYKGSQAIVINNRIVGGIHIFYPSEIRNQSSATTQVKLNTIAAEVENYVKTDLGYGSGYILSTVDRVELSMCGLDGLFHSVTGTYTPAAGTTSFTMYVPYYLGQTLGVGYVSFPITLSSTSVTTSKYPSTSQYNNNKVAWVMNKTSGWGLSTLEGNQTSQKGMTVESEFKYEGSNSSNVSVYLQSTGMVRFRNFIADGEDIIDFNFTPVGASKTASITIVP